MKIISVILLSCFVYSSFARFLPQFWSKRVEKYKAIESCDYYITSEAEYRDVIPITNPVNETTKSLIKFFTYATGPFKFQLSLLAEIDYQSPPRSSMSQAEWRRRFSRHRRHLDDFWDWTILEETTKVSPDEQQSTDDTAIENVSEGAASLSDGIVTTEEQYRQYTPLKRSVCRNYEIVLESGGHVSVIGHELNTLKMLYAPDLVYIGEPNEIVVELHDKMARVIVNDRTPIQFKIDQGSQFESISFASCQADQRQEFFYNFD